MSILAPVADLRPYINRKPNFSPVNPFRTFAAVDAMSITSGPLWSDTRPLGSERCRFAQWGPGSSVPEAATCSVTRHHPEQSRTTSLARTKGGLSPIAPIHRLYITRAQFGEPPGITGRPMFLYYSSGDGSRCTCLSLAMAVISEPTIHQP